MRKKFQRRRTVIIPIMSRNIQRTSSTCNNREPTSFLPSITYFFLASNSIGAMCRAYGRGDYSLLSFIVFAYSAFLLLDCCSSAYQRLPPHEKSLKKDFLKFAIWLLFSAIMFGVSYQFAPYFPHVAYGLSLYVVATLGSAFLFYVYMIFDGTSGGCDECDGEEKTKFTDEYVRAMKIERYDSVMEKV